MGADKIKLDIYTGVANVTVWTISDYGYEPISADLIYEVVNAIGKCGINKLLGNVTFRKDTCWLTISDEYGTEYDHSFKLIKPSCSGAEQWCYEVYTLLCENIDKCFDGFMELTKDDKCQRTELESGLTK